MERHNSNGDFDFESKFSRSKGSLVRLSVAGEANHYRGLMRAKKALSNQPRQNVTTEARRHGERQKTLPLITLITPICVDSGLPNRRSYGLLITVRVL